MARPQRAEGRGLAFELGGFAVEDGGAGVIVQAHPGGAEFVADVGLGGGGDIAGGKLSSKVGEQGEDVHCQAFGTKRRKEFSPTWKPGSSAPNGGNGTLPRHPVKTLS